MYVAVYPEILEGKEKENGGGKRRMDGK